MNKENSTCLSFFDGLLIQKYKLNELMKMNAYLNLFYMERTNSSLMSLFFSRCYLNKEDKKDKVS